MFPSWFVLSPTKMVDFNNSSKKNNNINEYLQCKMTTTAKILFAYFMPKADDELFTTTARRKAMKDKFQQHQQEEQ